jgi:hypothetical protein
LNFIKWIYAHSSSFWFSFIFFFTFFLPIPRFYKTIILIIIALLFYFRYLREIFKIRPELKIKPLHIILYLCTSEIIPFGIFLYSIIRLV